MDNVEIQDIQVTEQQQPVKLNPWISMLTEPRSTIQDIADNSPYKHFFILIFASSIVIGIMDTVEHPSVLSKAILNIFLFCPLSTFVLVFINSFLIWLTGLLFNGKGNNMSIRAALTWSLVPFIWGIPLLAISIPLLYAYKIFWPYALSKLFILLWSFTLHYQTTSQIQGYKSIWQTFFNLAAAEAILVITMYVIIIYSIKYNLFWY